MGCSTARLRPLRQLAGAVSEWVSIARPVLQLVSVSNGKRAGAVPEPVPRLVGILVVLRDGALVAYLVENSGEKAGAISQLVPLLIAGLVSGETPGPILQVEVLPGPKLAPAVHLGAETALRLIHLLDLILCA